jgi:hypothetical protein
MARMTLYYGFGHVIRYKHMQNVFEMWIRPKTFVDMDCSFKYPVLPYVRDFGIETGYSKLSECYGPLKI